MSRIDLTIVNRGFTDVNPRVVGSHVCPPLHFYGPKMRRTYQIHFILSGRGVFRYKNNEYNLKENDLFISAPDQIVYYAADAVEPWSYIWVGFESTLPIEEIFGTPVPHAPACRHIFEECMRAEEYGERAEFFLCSKIYELIAHLTRRKSEDKRQYALMAKNYIETRYDRQISVTALADKLGLERSYFGKIFKSEVGVSPQQYLINTRLEQAALLMREQHLPPAQAAAYCGYTDLFNFSKMFKKRYGIAPRFYYNQTQNVTKK